MCQNYFSQGNNVFSIQSQNISARLPHNPKNYEQIHHWNQKDNKTVNFNPKKPFTPPHHFYIFMGMPPSHSPFILC